MSVSPAIDRRESHPKLNCKLLLGQLQGLSEFSDQLTNSWLLNTNV